MKWSCSHSIRATAVYADIFNFALTDEELVRWLLVLGRSQHYTQGTILTTARRVLVRTGQYWTLVGRTGLARIRMTKQKASQVKLQHAQSVARWLALIPTIRLVGITGGLAMDNAGQEDDIDLFFIVSDGTIWISRLLAIAIVEIVSKRRRPGDIHVSDAICLNMFMAEKALALPVGERDVYSSHEVLQMQPLFVRGGVYMQFLQANSWVKRFLPYAWKERYGMAKGKDVRARFNILNIVLRMLEAPARFIQIRYMKGKQTTEIVTDEVLRFHPRDARPWVYNIFVRRCRKHKITLDKNFWAA